MMSLTSEIVDRVNFSQRDHHLHLRPQIKQAWSSSETETVWMKGGLKVHCCQLSTLHYKGFIAHWLLAASTKKVNVKHESVQYTDAVHVIVHWCVSQFDWLIDCYSSFILMTSWGFFCRWKWWGGINFPSCWQQWQAAGAVHTVESRDWHSRNWKWGPETQQQLSFLASVEDRWWLSWKRWCWCWRNSQSRFYLKTYSVWWW